MATEDPNLRALGDSLPGAAFLGLDRAAIRTRESARTSSAWCLSVSASAGAGRISLVEIEGGTSCYRGEGIFLGWPQARLAAAYRKFLPRAPDPVPDAGQFG